MKLKLQGAIHQMYREDNGVLLKLTVVGAAETAEVSLHVKGVVAEQLHYGERLTIVITTDDESET